MPDQGGEKTEQASPKKREDERKKGNIFMSKDIITIASIFASFYAISFFVSVFVGFIKENFLQQMARIVDINVLTAGDVMDLYKESLILFAINALPPMLIIALVTVLSVGVQTRFLVSYEQIKFKLERINPIKGMQRLISLRSLVELVKSLIKIALLVWILYINISALFQMVPSMLDWDIEQAINFTGTQIMSLVLSTGLAFAAVAAIDFLYQRWEYEKNIRMTKQEVKDEYKQLEGNPEIRSARQQKQREFAQRRMMQQVQRADVVVRNPTHYAVALRYDLERDSAPLVLAKGQDHIAMRIVEEAGKHGIMTIENRPLARSLYELSDIDEMIPAELYQPVAELLAWLYSTKKKAG